MQPFLFCNGILEYILKTDIQVNLKIYDSDKYKALIFFKWAKCVYWL